MYKSSAVDFFQPGDRQQLKVLVLVWRCFFQKTTRVLDVRLALLEAKPKVLDVKWHPFSNRKA